MTNREPEPGTLGGLLSDDLSTIARRVARLEGELARLRAESATLGKMHDQVVQAAAPLLAENGVMRGLVQRAWAILNGPDRLTDAKTLEALSSWHTDAGEALRRAPAQFRAGFPAQPPAPPPAHADHSEPAA